MIEELFTVGTNSGNIVHLAQHTETIHTMPLVDNHGKTHVYNWNLYVL